MTMLARLALAGVLGASLLASQGVSRTTGNDEALCGGVVGLEAAFEAHVKAFNTPRDIPAMLAFEEDLVELGHTGRDFVDFGTMSREEHQRRVQEGSGKTEVYEWTPAPFHTRVFGPTGLVWGSYARRHKPVGGETRAAEGFFTATYVCSEGRWRSVLWHRSPRR
jgi:hypothetical protein